MTRPTNDGGFESHLADDHDLSWRARAYGEGVVGGKRWPLSELDLGRVSWATSTRARRQNGSCSYGEDDDCTVTVAAHVADRAGFDACRETIRHELVHAWQHQHAGEVATVGDGAPEVGGGHSAGRTVRIDPGHGPSFRAWVDPLELEGRCAAHYDRTPGEYAYVYECPRCEEWWGRHRLCPSVRQAAHGTVGPAGYRYCVDCDALVHLRAANTYLDHADHVDDTIRAFADGEVAGLPTTPVDSLSPTAPPGGAD